MRSWSHRSHRWAFNDAVVFSGGGNAGAAQVGMAQALFEAGVRPDLLVGCSVGALNATYLAIEPSLARVDGLRAIWESVGTNHVFSGTRRSVATHFIKRHDHIFEADGLRALIGGAIEVDDLSDTAIPVHVVTTDLTAGVPVWWSSGNPIDVLSASSCLPGVFPPVRIGSQLHVDGGVLCPVPVGRALSLGAHRVWVLDVCGGRPPRLPVRPSALDVLLTSFSLARYALQGESTASQRPGQEVTVIAPELPPNLDVRDFSRTAELIAAGLQAGRRAMTIGAALASARAALASAS